MWFAGVNTNSLIPNLSTWPTNQLARPPGGQPRDRPQRHQQDRASPVSSRSATNASGIVLPNFAADLAPAVKRRHAVGDGEPDGGRRSVLTQGRLHAQGQAATSLKGKEVDDHDHRPVRLHRLRRGRQDHGPGPRGRAHQGSLRRRRRTPRGMPRWPTRATAARRATGRTRRSDVPASTRAGSTARSRPRARATPRAVTSRVCRTRRSTASCGRSSAATTTTATLKAIAPIEQYVAKNLPVIPTVYGASFDEYNSAAFTGWPSASNPYERGSPTAEQRGRRAAPEAGLLARTQRRATGPAPPTRGERGLGPHPRLQTKGSIEMTTTGARGSACVARTFPAGLPLGGGDRRLPDRGRGRRRTAAAVDLGHVQPHAGEGAAAATPATSRATSTTAARTTSTCSQRSV